MSLPLCACFPLGSLDISGLDRGAKSIFFYDSGRHLLGYGNLGAALPVGVIDAESVTLAATPYSLYELQLDQELGANASDCPPSFFSPSEILAAASFDHAGFSGWRETLESEPLAGPVAPSFLACEARGGCLYHAPVEGASARPLCGECSEPSNVVAPTPPGWCGDHCRAEAERQRERCVIGTRERLGEPGCRAISACLAGPWPPEVTRDEIHVLPDGALEPPGADGSSALPYVGLDRALAGAPSGVTVLLSDGEYTLTQPAPSAVHFVGLCSPTTRIETSTMSFAAGSTLSVTHATLHLGGTAFVHGRLELDEGSLIWRRLLVLPGAVLDATGSNIWIRGTQSRIGGTLALHDVELTLSSTVGIVCAGSCEADGLVMLVEDPIPPPSDDPKAQVPFALVQGARLDMERALIGRLKSGAEQNGPLINVREPSHASVRDAVLWVDNGIGVQVEVGGDVVLARLLIAGTQFHMPAHSHGLNMKTILGPSESTLLISDLEVVGLDLGLDFSSLRNVSAARIRVTETEHALRLDTERSGAISQGMIEDLDLDSYRPIEMGDGRWTIHRARLRVGLQGVVVTRSGIPNGNMFHLLIEDFSIDAQNPESGSAPTPAFDLAQLGVDPNHDAFFRNGAVGPNMSVSVGDKCLRGPEQVLDRVRFEGGLIAR